MAIKTNLDTAAISYPEFETGLPSGGWAYRTKETGFPEKIIVMPYSWETQGILTTNLSASDKLKRVASMVVKGLPEGFSTDSLLTSDQYYILAIARSLTYGENYKFQADCNKCGHKEKISVKVPNELPVRSWEFKNQAEFQKYLTITLPVCKDSIVLKYPSIFDDMEVGRINRLNRVAKKLEEDDEKALINRIAVHIKSVNNSTPDTFDEVSGYVSRIMGADMAFLQDQIDEKNCGITYSWDVECDKCSNQYEVRIPIQQHFFRRE
jgi:hypothetical protein